MKRWVRRLVWFAIGLAAILAVVLLAVQVVLWDGRLPRRLVAEGLAAQTGLRTQVARVRTGWLGETVLEGLELSIPLEDAPLATVPRMRVAHTNLLAIILGAPLEIDAADLEKPEIRVREGPPGEWNIARALDLIARAQAADQKPPSPTVRLPAVEVSEGTLILERADGRALTAPLALNSETDATGGWTFTLTLPQQGEVKGRVAPGGEWLHEAAFDLNGVEAIAALWADETPSPLSARGTWRGRISDGGIAATAAFEPLVIGSERATGSLLLTAGKDGARITPSGLELRSPMLPGGQPLLLRSGTLSLQVDRASADGILAEWMGSSIALHGFWDPARREAEATATWSSVATRGDGTHEGELRLTAQLPQAGVRRIEGRLISTGRGLGGAWDSEVAAAVTGTSWTALNASITARRLMWTDDEGTIDLAGIGTRLEMTWPQMRLRSLNVPNANVVTAFGEADFESLAWALEVEIRDWLAPRLSERGPAEVIARAEGRGSDVSVPQARLVIAGAEVDAKGRYTPETAGGPPLLADVTFAVPPRTHGTEPAAMPDSGRWRVEATVTGELSPLNLSATGRAVGQDVKAPGEPLAPIEMTWRGGADTKGAWARTDPFELLGGMWVLRAAYAGEQTLGSLNISLTEVPLGAVAKVAGAPIDLGGVLTAEVDVAAPGLDLTQLSLSGAWSVERPIADRFGVERGRGRIRTRRGRVDFTDILLELGEGQVVGSVGFNLSEPQRLDVELTSRRWPVQIEGTPVGVLVDAAVDLELDVVERWARGRVDLTAPVLVQDEPYGELAIRTRLEGRTVAVDTLAAEIAEGGIAGTMRIPLDDLVSATAEISWDGLDLAQLVRPWSDVEGIEGTMSGRITAAPAQDPRAPEPLRIDLTLRPDGASWRGTTLGDGLFTLFAGPDRVLLDRSEVFIAGGRIRTWSRLSWHGDEPFVHVQTDLDHLNLDNLLRMAAPDAPHAPGRLTGRLSFGGYAFEPRRMFGSGRIEIDQSELGDLPVISHLYGLLSLSPGGDVPTGKGFAELRLEEYAIVIRRLEYFNRGTDLIASGRIYDIRRGPDSPVSGVAIARVRPLRDLGLPFMRDLDEMLTAMQTGGESVRIDGTVSHLEVHPVPFSEIGGFLRGLIGGN